MLCDDGVDVRAYMKSEAPPHLCEDDVIIQTLDEVGFPEALQKSHVTQVPLLGTWSGVSAVGKRHRRLSGRWGLVGAREVHS